MDSSTVEYPCVTCRHEVEESNAALVCDLYDRWEHVACIRQCDKLSEP